MYMPRKTRSNKNASRNKRSRRRTFRKKLEETMIGYTFIKILQECTTKILVMETMMDLTLLIK